jgi:hypothetical protein
MTTAIVALCLTAVGILGGILALFFKIGRQVGSIEKHVKQIGRLATHVPGLYHRVSNIERRLDISSPDFPSFFESNGHDAEE